MESRQRINREAAPSFSTLVNKALSRNGGRFTIPPGHQPGRITPVISRVKSVIKLQKILLPVMQASQLWLKAHFNLPGSC